MGRAVFKYAPMPVLILLEGKVVYRNVHGRHVALDTPKDKVPHPYRLVQQGYFEVVYGPISLSKKDPDEDSP